MPKPTRYFQETDPTSIHEASLRLGWSWSKTRRALDKGLIESVRLPNGTRAVIRTSLEHLAHRLAAEGNISS